jgi:hypothetical protein
MGARAAIMQPALLCSQAGRTMRIMSSFGQTPLLFVCTVLASLASAAAHVTTLRIDRVEPFAACATFGGTGAYERVIGIARGELDPADPRNNVIVGIDRAPRNTAGMVEYETDLFILRPVDPAKGNRQLLFDVVNRGNKVITNTLNRPTPKDDSNDPSTAPQAGDGFLFRRGYTIAWAGWDLDAPTANAGMTIRVPALPDVEREIRDEFVSATRGPPMAHFKLSYTAASLDPATARLTMRARAALGTYTGFNLYKAPYPEGEMCDRDGSFLPFARSEAEKTPGDPRRSLVERYGTREQYVARVAAEATRLVRERLLLPEDADHYVAEAKSAAAIALPQ